MASLYTTRISRSPPAPRSADPPANSTAQVSSDSPPNAAIMQPIPRRAIQLPLDTDQHGADAEPALTVDSSIPLQNNRIHYLHDTSDFHLRVPRTSTTSRSSSSPYLRPSDGRTVRSKHRSVPKLKQSHSDSSIAPSYAHEYPPANFSTSIPLSDCTGQPPALPLPHFFDPGLSISNLPHLLGGSQSIFYPREWSENEHTNASPVEGLWDAMGGSADWVYQGQSHMLPHT